VPAGGRAEPLERAAPWLLGAASLALCLAFFSKWPTEWDSVNLTIGVDRFDVRENSPHPPGYWLYVAAARLVRLLTPLSAQRSLQVLAALAAAGTVALVYVLGRDAKNPWLGGAAAAVTATTPYLLFYGATPASYCFDALLSVALLVLALRAKPGSRHGLYAAALLGLGSGLRPSTLVIMFPIALWAVAKSRTWVPAAAAGLVGLLVWAVPMFIEQPGGVGDYWTFSRAFFKPAFSTASLFYGATWPQARANMAHAGAYTVIGLAGLVPLLLLGLPLARRSHENRSREPLLLLTLAVIVPLAFLLLVYFGKGGYVLSLLPAAVLLALWPAASTRGVARVAMTVAVAAVCLVDLQRFAMPPGLLPPRFRNQANVWFTQDRYGAPFPLTHRYMRTVDDEVDDYRAILKEFDPAKDVVVYINENGGYRFRHGCLALRPMRVHYVVNRTDHFLCKQGRMLTEHDNDIELPAPGGRAIFTLDVPIQEVTDQVAAGRLQKHVLSTGRLVYVAPEGVGIYGVTPVASPDHPLRTHSP
jgi:hypothetical protein